MIIQLIQIAKILLIAYTVTRFVPLQMFLESIPDSRNNFINLLMNTITLLLTCSKCFCLWFGLILTHDIYLSCLASFLMVIVEKYILIYIEQIKFINPYGNKEE